METVDERFMRRALELAALGRGWVEPNPMVGAVVVRDGVIVGEGWHERFGHAHAEIHALRQAGGAARGATLYVTLEPCCHHGKTPPCTDAVLASGIRRVIAAMLDPFPPVSGKGFALLQAAGVIVDSGIGESLARRLNAGYLRRLRAGRPQIHAKWAMTLDGKIQTRTGSSQWITSEAARARVHQLRGLMDAIVVGAGTLRADDPLLTARPPGPRTPARIVLGGTTPLPARPRLLQTISEAPVQLLLPEDHAHDVNAWESAGAEVTRYPCRQERLPMEVIAQDWGRRGYTHVLIEGGANVLGACFDAGLIDEVHAFIAPKLVGGATASTPIGGTGIDRMADAWQLEAGSWEPLGSDLYYHAYRVEAPG